MEETKFVHFNGKEYLLTDAWITLIESVIDRAVADTASRYGETIPVYVVSVGVKWIATIKLIREIKNWSLKESKEFTDKVRDGKKMLLARLPYHEAVALRARFISTTDAIVELPSPLEMLGKQAEV